MVKDIRAKILCNDKIGQGYFKMALDAPAIARDARPGQFVQIRCSDCLDPLLRRPFSIHRVRGVGSRVKEIEILYEVIGKGTELLSNKINGDFLDVLGPLGNGFIFPLFTIHHSPFTILVAGGIGVAPLVFLAEELARKKIKTIVLIGAKTKNLILCEKDFKKVATKVHIATDDGSRGCKGFVSKLFEQLLRTTNACPAKPSAKAAWRRRDERPLGFVPRQAQDFARGRRTTIYACGPHSMLQRIAEISRAHKIECQVSLEEKMACGIGACLGCAVKVKGKKAYKLACKDGPVFDADHISWR